MYTVEVQGLKGWQEVGKNKYMGPAYDAALHMVMIRGEKTRLLRDGQVVVIWGEAKERQFVKCP